MDSYVNISEISLANVVTNTVRTKSDTVWVWVMQFSQGNLSVLCVLFRKAHHAHGTQHSIEHSMQHSTQHTKAHSATHDTLDDNEIRETVTAHLARHTGTYHACSTHGMVRGACHESNARVNRFQHLKYTPFMCVQNRVSFLVWREQHTKTGPRCKQLAVVLHAIAYRTVASMQPGRLGAADVGQTGITAVAHR